MDLNWHAETLRVSLFTKAAPKIGDSDWAAITGQEEAETRSQIPGGRALIGPFLNGQLTLASAGNRLDCILSPAPKETLSADTGFPTIGLWSETVQQFLTATSPWVGKAAFPVTRIAFGAVLLLPVEGREDAYEKLNTLLTSVNVTPEMRELIFRVNWQRKSGVIPALTVNRLTSWSALKVAFGTLMLSPGTMSAVEMIPKADLVRLEVDHNTDQDRVDPIDPEELVSIYEELVALADDNAKRGEVR